MARQSKAHTRVIEFPRRHHRNKTDEEKNKLNSKQGETTPALRHEAKASGRRKRDVAGLWTSKRPRHGTRVALPDDIMPDILLRLPAQSIIRFRSVCKLFYSVTNDPSFNHSYATRAAPALLFRTTGTFPDPTGCREAEWHSDLHLAYNKSRHKGGDDGLQIEVMKWTRINHCRKKGLTLLLQASCDGMLYFFVHRERRHYVCNPLIGDWIPLPDSTNRLHRHGNIIGFYFHMPAGEYRLLSFMYGHKKKGSLYRCEVLTLGSREWRRIKDSPLDCLADSAAIPMHHRRHWIFTEYIDAGVQTLSIMVFDMQVEEFSKISVPCGDIDGNHHHLMRLREGQLGLCQVTKSMEILVYILEDYTREVWVKQYTISFQGVPVPIPLGNRGHMPTWIGSGFDHDGIPHIRPMMTAHDDREILFVWYESSDPLVLGVFSFNTKLNELRNVRVKGSFPSNHLDDTFHGQYIETPVSCHYLNKRRGCLHCGRDN